jgi:hypothetical protein
MKDGARLREQWNGGPCFHPGFYREVAFAGQKTGDHVCTQCGEVFSPHEMRAIEATRKPT